MRRSVKYLIFVVFVEILPLIVPSAFGEVSLYIYQNDGQTPFDCNEGIMVGTTISLVIASDSNDYWSGGLFIEGQDRLFGTLTGGDYDPNTRDYFGSHLEDAGGFARVTDWKDSSIWGFDLYTFYPIDENSPNDGNSYDEATTAGDWFIIDYEATQLGNCNVGFYDYSVSWYQPIEIITFSNVVSRDLNSDDKVNFLDFAVFASEWYSADCGDPNWCNGADLDFSGMVDVNDLALFVEFWLWGTPDDLVGPAGDPNVVYSIVDANGYNDITIDVNESVTLYVNMETNDVNIVYFDIEVDISNTNVGCIDNTEYDSQNPPGPGTAQILAQPRDEFLDYWGPGIQQQEGIRLVGGTGVPDVHINDGYLASFVFTCLGIGDVELTLINWESLDEDSEYVYPTRNSIVIHQIDQYGQTMMTSGTEEMLTTQDSEITQSDIDELVEFTEQLWKDEKELRDNMTKKELDEFIEIIKAEGEEIISTL